MKKTINKATCLLTLLSLLILACKDKKSDQRTKTNEQILRESGSVISVGKVVPEAGWTMISSLVPGIVKKIRVKEGDIVEEGQVVLELEEGNENLLQQQREAELNTLQSQLQVTMADLDKERVALQELQAVYQNSKSLLEKNAETAEKTAGDYSKWKQQEKIVESMQAKLRSDRIALEEKKIQLMQSKNDVKNLLITAQSKGTVSELAVEVGQSIDNKTELGKVVGGGDFVIEAEVDELFAPKIQVGQPAIIHSIGRRDSLSSGKVIYASQTLLNKSILYETVGESEDRRIRKIKIKPDQGKMLFINSKVECEIKIK